jgi:hypothetical protein
MTQLLLGEMFIVPWWVGVTGAILVVAAVVMSRRSKSRG